MRYMLRRDSVGKHATLLLSYTIGQGFIVTELRDKAERITFQEVNRLLYQWFGSLLQRI